MPTVFDNLNDVSGKFTGTLCYYGKEVVFVKQADTSEKGEFKIFIQFLNGSRGKWIDVHDKDFSWNNYNIGYANAGNYTAWWYRIPHRQYRQGLRKDQMNVICPDFPHVGMEHPFQFSAPFVKMLQNEYPSREEIDAKLRSQAAISIAFHRDFALKWDNMHQDHILAYRGHDVGVSLNKKLSEFRIVPEFEHVHEALKEVLA